MELNNIRRFRNLHIENEVSTAEGAATRWRFCIFVCIRRNLGKSMNILPQSIAKELIEEFAYKTQSTEPTLRIIPLRSKNRRLKFIVSYHAWRKIRSSMRVNW